MFFDSVQSQANSQNTNLNNVISLGSTGTSTGFNPTNSANPLFKNTNDLDFSPLSGNSAGVALAPGSSAMGGATMSQKSQEEQYSTPTQSRPTFDGYTAPPQSSNMLLWLGIAVTFAFSLFSIYKRRKAK